MIFMLHAALDACRRCRHATMPPPADAAAVDVIDARYSAAFSPCLPLL